MLRTLRGRKLEKKTPRVSPAGLRKKRRYSRGTYSALGGAAGRTPDPASGGSNSGCGQACGSLDGTSAPPSTRNCGAPDQIGVCYSSAGSRHSAVTPTGLSLVSTEEVLLVIFRTAVIGLVACIIVSGASPAAGNDQRSGVHWLRKCTNPEPSLQMECAIYVRALVEYDEVRAKMLGQKRFICPHI